MESSYRPPNTSQGASTLAFLSPVIDNLCVTSENYVFTLNTSSLKVRNQTIFHTLKSSELAVWSNIFLKQLNEVQCAL